VLLLKECLLLFISLSTQSGNFWIHPRINVVADKTSLNKPIRKYEAEDVEIML
jgi:hypothetical protein